MSASKIILVTGGSRSGKSAFALRYADSVSGSRTFIATCPVTDDEMRARIQSHQNERAEHNWTTIEEETDLCGALHSAGKNGVVIVDCLTLWINNLMYAAHSPGNEMTETDVVSEAEAMLRACRATGGIVILVTNEVGLGIVPENESARRFRDLAGRCNQTVAAGADAVVFVVCGIPTTIKGEL